MSRFCGLIMSLFLLSLYTGACFGAPTIGSVRNEIQPDSSFITVVIDGINLGQRPNVVYYNDFRKEQIYTSLSASGQLAGVSRLRAGRVPMVTLYDSTPGFYVVDDATDQITMVEALIGEAQSKVFVSYSVAIPKGFTAPATPEPKKWFEGSSWKLNWLLQSPQAFSVNEEFDLCGPTLIGTNSALMGNASLFVLPSGASYIHARVADWWAWDVFNHIQVIFDGNLTDPKSSTGSFSAVNNRVDYINFPQNTEVSAYKGPPPLITQINFPGWARNTLEDNFQAVYSNIYISAGDDFLNRVEITDSQEYVKSSYRRVIFPKEWSPTQIKFDVYKNEIKTYKDLFLHYFDSKGVRQGAGYKVCIQCPKPVE